MDQEADEHDDDVAEQLPQDVPAQQGRDDKDQPEHAVGG